MAYKRRYRKYKRRYRRYRKRYRASMPMHVAELKTVDVPAPATASQFLPTATGTLVLLNGTSEGPSSYQRIGRQIRMKSLDFRFNCRSIVGASGPTASTVGRIMIVYDRNTKGVAPTVPDIISSVNSAGAVTQSTMSGTNPYNMARFRIIFDNEVVFPAVDTNGAAFSNVFGGSQSPLDVGKAGTYNDHVFFKLKNLPVQYNGATAAVGDIVSGSLYLVFFAEVANFPIGLYYSARLRFYD